MVICCVPNCGADSWKCDGSLTFYDFPSNTDLSAKWIKQINTAVKTRPMWFPRGKSVICSKHFLHTDFKGDTDTLKARCVPTVFGHKYIGPNPESNETKKSNESKTTPLIVKVIKPPVSVVGNDSLNISDVHSETNVDDNSYNDEESAGNMEIDEDNLHVSSHDEAEDVLHISSNNVAEDSLNVSSLDVSEADLSHKIDESSLQVLPLENTRNSPHTTNESEASCSQTTNEKPNRPDAQQHRNNTLGDNGIKLRHVSKGNSSKQTNPMPRIFKKKEKNSSDLIEIGPNTFLKINPDIIKVNKKKTPSGNTVLQFLMDQKLAKSYSSDLLPKLIQGIKPSVQENSSFDVAESSDNYNNKKDITNDKQKESVQHVLGHVVDTQAYEETCADLHLSDDDIIMEDSHIINNLLNKKSGSPKKADSSFIDKAPVLLTTNMPLSHCFIDKPKYILQLKQKSRQIASLKFKVSNLTKKIEELEDRCIVQERQLSYSFIKRLKSIRKNASKGDPRATYILEQIRGYSNNSKMRWSDTTLTQCAIWCRKAPYAYEYFKKADFFKLPCLGSVKRYIKKHPEIKFQRKIGKCGPQPQDGKDDDNDESSDFDFDDSDGQNGTNEMSEEEKNEVVTCETILSVPSEEVESVIIVPDLNVKDKNYTKESNEIRKATESIANHSPDPSVQNNANDDTIVEKSPSNSKHIESNGVPITVDSSNLELQEIILPSGEVVQCYSSTIGNSADIGGQYYIIPNVGEQNSSGDHEYSVIQADSLPIVLQNLDTSQLHLQQDQLIFIANSSDQVECSETEVTTV